MKLVICSYRTAFAEDGFDWLNGLRRVDEDA